MAKKDPKQDRADLLAKIPPSATRVLIVTAKGIKKYKPVEEVLDSDVIQTNKSGDPVVMKKSPGRKKPTIVGPANATVAVLIRRKEEALGADPVLLKAKKDPDSPDVLHEVILGISEEAASLRFERDEAAREGRDSSGMSAKRVQALRAVGDTWLKRKDQLAGKVIDMDSQGFQELFKFMMSTLKDAMNSVKMRDEEIETVFAKFASMITDDWKVEAKNRMKNVT